MGRGKKLIALLGLFGVMLLASGSVMAAEPYVIGALWDITGHSSVIGAPSKEIADIWLDEVKLHESAELLKEEIKAREKILMLLEGKKGEF